MHSEWKVTTNLIGSKRMYAVYRIKDIDKVDHSGNREYATTYMEDKQTAEIMAKVFNEGQSKYPPCKIKICPFCGCMSDNTCKIENVAESAPWLILEHADRIDYCGRPKVFMDKLNMDGGVS